MGRIFSFVKYVSELDEAIWTLGPEEFGLALRTGRSARNPKGQFDLSPRFRGGSSSLFDQSVGTAKRLAPTIKIELLSGTYGDRQ